MERLTKKEMTELKNGQKIVCCNYKDEDCDDYCMYGYCTWNEKALKKLKELEDLEEQGLLLRLPCKVGDTLYQVIADINEYKVTAIGIYEGKVVICADNLDTGIGFSFGTERIGRR